MVFSSHRFGKLTRHADLILYVVSIDLHRSRIDVYTLGTWMSQALSSQARTMNYCRRRAITRASGRCRPKRSFEACLLWYNVLLNVTVLAARLPHRRECLAIVLWLQFRAVLRAHMEVHTNRMHVTVASCKVRFAVRFTRRVVMFK